LKKEKIYKESQKEERERGRDIKANEKKEREGEIRR
jgi:hypothetical protein